MKKIDINFIFYYITLLFILNLLFFILKNPYNIKEYNKFEKTDSLLNIIYNKIDSLENRKIIIYKKIKNIEYKIKKNEKEIKNIKVIHNPDSLLISINRTTNQIAKKE